MPVITVISTSIINELRNNLLMILTSVVQDRVDQRGFLIILPAAVVSRHVIRALVAQLRTDFQILRYPVRHADGVTAVARGEARTLTLFIVVKLIADRQHVALVQLEVQIVDDTEFTGLARQRGRGNDTRRTTRTEAWNAAAKHAIGLGQHVYALVEAMTPGHHIHLHVVVVVVGAVD